MINERSDNEGGLSTADIVLATNTMVMRSAHLFPIPTLRTSLECQTMTRK